MQNGHVKSALRAGREILQAARHEAAKLLADSHTRAVEEQRRISQSALELAEQGAAAKLLERTRENDKLIEENSSTIAEIALAVAEEVIAEQINLCPQTLLNRIERAIAEARLRNVLRLSVNPGDFDMVRAGLQGSLEKGFILDLLADESMPQGDARLETAAGSVEASVKSHLAAIRNCLGVRPQRLLLKTAIGA